MSEIRNLVVSALMRILAWPARLVQRHRMVASVSVHNLLFALALLIAFTVRMDAGSPGRLGGWWGQYLAGLPFFLAVKSLVFWRKKIFHSSWQYASIRDIADILLASWYFLLVFFPFLILCYYVPQKLGREPLVFYSRAPNGSWYSVYSTTIPLLDFMATIFLVGTARLSVRLYREELRPMAKEGVRRVLIVGAGNAAEVLLREINRMSLDRYRVVGLVDDDPNKQGAVIHGAGVLGTTEDIPALCAAEKIDEILIAIPSASQKELRRIVTQCQGANLQFRILPGMDSLLEGRFTVSQIRKVEIADLLGREAVRLDDAAVRAFIRDRCILITGAGGSIGSEMSRQVCAYGPRRLVLLEQAENNLFYIHGELTRTFPGLNIVPVICDIYERAAVLAAFQRQRPDVVIHAAAHKHVPLMELNPGEALKNNVFGTKNVADAACAAGVREFVQISTDKAVNPSSIMGCTKRVAEIYTQALNGREGCPTQFKSVRFGNVLGSAGSVVPSFEEQIRRGGPVTVTHPDMTRYFMTIPEAAQLVLQAAATGKGGEIFLLDMGEPVKIVDLARDMITLSGLRVGEDIDIVFTGMRPGEKLFEELRTEGEDIGPTTHPKVKVWKHRPKEWTDIQRFLDAAAQLVHVRPERQRVIDLLKTLVPEYQPQNPPAAEPAPAATTAPAAPAAASPQQ